MDVRMYGCMDVWMSGCLYVCIYVCMYVRTYVRTYVCMYVCMYVYVYINLCLRICMQLCLIVCVWLRNDCMHMFVRWLKFWHMEHVPQSCPRSSSHNGVRSDVVRPEWFLDITDKASWCIFTMLKLNLWLFSLDMESSQFVRDLSWFPTYWIRNGDFALLP